MLLLFCCLGLCSRGFLGPCASHRWRCGSVHFFLADEPLRGSWEGGWKGGRGREGAERREGGEGRGGEGRGGERGEGRGEGRGERGEGRGERGEGRGERGEGRGERGEGRGERGEEGRGGEGRGGEGREGGREGGCKIPLYNLDSESNLDMRSILNPLKSHNSLFYATRQLSSLAWASLEP